jgi:hypothetical protein
VSLRRGYGDETWALAYAEDVEGLERVAGLLLHEHMGIEYEGRRARAFALALERRTAQALEELNAGWTDEWPTPDAYGLDVARIHFCAGDPAKALTALQLDARTVERAQLEDVVTLVLDCVYADRTLGRRGFRLALASSQGLERVLVAGRMLRAWVRGRDRAARFAQPVTPGS